MTTTRITTIALWAGAAFFLIFGIWPMVAPHSFYEQIALFPPYNRHLLHDIGAFQIGIGATLALAALFRDAKFVALAGAATGAGVHFIGHIVDHDLGGDAAQTVTLGIVATVLLAGAALRWNPAGASGA